MKSTKPMSDRAKGLLFSATGVLVITPDGLLTRLVETDPWTLIFWRGLLSGLGICLILLFLHRGIAWQKIRTVGVGGLLVALTMSLGSITFVYSLTHTTVANSLFIVSTSPIFAALIGWIFLKEALSPRTWLVIAVVLSGIGIIAVGNGIDGGSMPGNLAALVTAVLAAGSFSIIRNFKERSMIPAAALAGFLSALWVIPLARPTSLTPAETPIIIIMGLVMLPLAFALMYIGPRYLPVAEVSLMVLLEAILGPLWVWLVVGEDPGGYTLVGGTIVLVALAVNALLPAREAQAARTPKLASSSAPRNDFS